MQIIYACLVPVFENTENTIFVLSQNCFCSLDLVFSTFSVLSLFICTKKTVFKNRKP